MGYQGDRRYGYDRYAGQGYSNPNQDRGDSGYGGDRDERGYRYGTRGQFGGSDYGRSGYGRNDYGRGRPDDYDPDERGFFDRASDEVRSWFGDEEAERRREYDERYDQGDTERTRRTGYASPSSGTRYQPNRGYGAAGRGDRAGHHDANYHAWRQQRIDELDSDYSEYQRENRDRFNSEFGSWRTRRGEQRQAVSQVREHMDVVGSDGAHVGTVDKLRGDRIILTKSDADAGGVHHSVPSSWIRSVDATKVTLEQTAEQAQTAWRTEREQNALFGDSDDSARGTSATYGSAYYSANRDR